MIVLEDRSNAFHESEISLARSVRFWLFLLFDIPSIYCSFIILFYLFIDKNLRSQLINHITINLLIIGLIIELIDIPFYLTFLHLGVVQPSTPFVCLLWWFMDKGLYNGFTIIMAWSSIHRYLSIYDGGFIFESEATLHFPLFTSDYFTSLHFDLLYDGDSVSTMYKYI